MLAKAADQIFKGFTIPILVLLLENLKNKLWEAKIGRLWDSANVPPVCEFKRKTIIRKRDFIHQ